jgi:hypothetical protein
MLFLRGLETEPVEVLLHARHAQRELLLLLALRELAIPPEVLSQLVRVESADHALKRQNQRTLLLLLLLMLLFTIRGECDLVVSVLVLLYFDCLGVLERHNQSLLVARELQREVGSRE